MAKNYFLQFGAGDPATYTGLTPTFIIFSAFGTSALTAPGITESPVGSGFYGFNYEPVIPVVFKVDGGASVPSADRYITNALDPIQAVDERIGTTSDSFGSTAVDPSTVIGYLKRNQEFSEGNAVFTKSSGLWDIYSRGSSTLLREKALTNTTSSATKS